MTTNLELNTPTRTHTHIYLINNLILAIQKNANIC